MLLFFIYHTKVYVGMGSFVGTAFCICCCMGVGVDEGLLLGVSNVVELCRAMHIL